MHRASGFLALEDKVTVLGVTASQASAMPQMESVAFSVRRIKKTASTEPQNVDVSVLSSLMSTFFSGHVFRVAQEVALVSKASGVTFTFRGAWACWFLRSCWGGEGFLVFMGCCCVIGSARDGDGRWECGRWSWMRWRCR